MTRRQQRAVVALSIGGFIPEPQTDPCATVCGHGVTAAVLESTGVYWNAPLRTIEAAGVRPALVHAQHVKQIKGRKTDGADSLWLARICQLGLARPSYVPPPLFVALRHQCRYRRKVVAGCATGCGRPSTMLDRPDG